MSLLLLLLLPVVLFATFALLRLNLLKVGLADQWWGFPLYMTTFLLIVAGGVAACVGIFVLAAPGVS